MDEWIYWVGKVDEYCTNSYCGRESTILQEKWFMFSSIYTHKVAIELMLCTVTEENKTDPNPEFFVYILKISMQCLFLNLWFSFYTAPLTHSNDGKPFFVGSGIHTSFFTDLEIPNVLLSLHLICHPKEWLYLFLWFGKMRWW